MSVRIQVIVEKRERQIFHEQARREGRSLSDWMRQAARDRLASVEDKTLKSPEDLARFFADCDERERAPEPTWQEHLAVIDESRVKGLPGS